MEQKNSKEQQRTAKNTKKHKRNVKMHPYGPSDSPRPGVAGARMYSQAAASVVAGNKYKNK
jgi:hypothetical protein